MDDSHFDALTRMVTEAGTRRGLLAILVTLPILSGVLALINLDETEAKGRRKRRKKRHKHGKGHDKGKHKRQPCKSQAKTTTCSGKCGSVKNNCKKTVDCGSCDCPESCEDCFICQEQGPNSPGACVVDPAMSGEPCGDPGQVCQIDGACACQAGSCPDDAPMCVDGNCTGCSDINPCPDGQVCCNNSCFAGVCCGAAGCPTAEAPDCVGHQCVCAADGNNPCDAGETCCPDGCANLQTNPSHCGDCETECGPGQTCQGGICGFECGGDFCPASTEICDNGTCQPCDVCATCDHTTIQAAIDASSSGDTVCICAGTYTGSGTNRIADVSGKNLTLVGAHAEATVLDGQEVSTSEPVLRLFNATSEVRQLSITGSNGEAGILLGSPAELILSQVWIHGNHSSAEGGGIAARSCPVTLNAGTRVFGNSSSFNAGGIYNANSESLLTLNSGSSVTGNSVGNEGGGIYNASGSVVLNAGSEVSGIEAASAGGGIVSLFSDQVTLNPGSLVCGNSNPECTGFTAATSCQDTWP